MHAPTWTHKNTSTRVKIFLILFRQNWFAGEDGVDGKFFLEEHHVEVVMERKNGTAVGDTHPYQPALRAERTVAHQVQTNVFMLARSLDNQHVALVVSGINGLRHDGAVRHGKQLRAIVALHGGMILEIAFSAVEHPHPAGLLHTVGKEVMIFGIDSRGQDVGGDQRTVIGHVLVWRIGVLETFRREQAVELALVIEPEHIFGLQQLRDGIVPHLVVFDMLAVYRKGDEHGSDAVFAAERDYLLHIAGMLPADLEIGLDERSPFLFVAVQHVLLDAGIEADITPEIEAFVFFRLFRNRYVGLYLLGVAENKGMVAHRGGDGFQPVVGSEQDRKRACLLPHVPAGRIALELVGKVLSFKVMVVAVVDGESLDHRDFRLGAAERLLEAVIRVDDIGTGRCQHETGGVQRIGKMLGIEAGVHAGITHEHHVHPVVLREVVE